MSFDSAQFRDLIERTLGAFDPKLASPIAVDLLMGTAAQESRLGSYLRQLGGGPAIGVFQMEPATFRWLQTKYGGTYPYIKGRDPDEMEWDLRLSILMARLRYWAVPRALPNGDLQSLAEYWHKHYCAGCKGTVEQFIEHYEGFVG